MSFVVIMTKKSIFNLAYYSEKYKKIVKISEPQTSSLILFL